MLLKPENMSNETLEHLRVVARMAISSMVFGARHMDALKMQGYRVVSINGRGLFKGVDPYLSVSLAHADVDIQPQDIPQIASYLRLHIERITEGNTFGDYKVEPVSWGLDAGTAIITDQFEWPGFDEPVMITLYLSIITPGYKLREHTVEIVESIMEEV